MKIETFLCEVDKSEMVKTPLTNFSVEPAVAAFFGPIKTNHLVAYACQKPGCRIHYEPLGMGYFLLDAKNKIDSYPTSAPRCALNDHGYTGLSSMDGKLKWICPEHTCTFSKDY